MATLHKLKSWDTVTRNGWHIKFSTLGDCESIVVLFFSKTTGQSIIESFSNEDSACGFINYVSNLDSHYVI